MIKAGSKSRDTIPLNCQTNTTSHLEDPHHDDGLGVEDGGGGDEKVQAGGEEYGRSEQTVGGKPGRCT